MELCYANSDRSLFRKYAKLVTWFANTGIGRDYLGVPKDIALLLPNGFIQGDRQIRKATFFSKEAYAARLSPVLTKIDLASQWIRDFNEAKSLFAWELGLTRRIPRLAGAILPSVTTKYSNSDGDGHVYATNAVWATVRGASTGTVTAGSLQVRSNVGYEIYRSFMPFDTSSIGTGSTVTEGRLSLYGSGYHDDAENDAEAYVVIVESTQASSTALATGDFDNIGSTAASTTVDVTSWADAAYNSFDLNATGRGLVSLTSYSKFAAREGHDMENNTPTAQTRADAYSADEAGTSKDPKLVVVYTPSGTTLFDSYAFANNDSDSNSQANTKDQGQNMVVQSTFAKAKMTSAQFFLKKVGSPTGNAVAQVWTQSAQAATGTPSVQVGGSSANLDISGLTTSYEVKELTWSSNHPVLSSGVYYCVLIDVSGCTLDGSNYISFGIDSSSPSDDGRLIYYDGSWSADASYDCIFQAYGESTVSGKPVIFSGGVAIG